jgi:hypothetical protein
MLSNFAHFSTFSHAMMLQTGAGSTEIWKRFLAPARCVAHFSAEAVEVFLETFPQTRQLLQDCEPVLIMSFRSWLREE